MASALPTRDVPTIPRKRGPNTPAGKARSAMNALRHGLRARGFALLPEEAPADWAEHLADLRRCLAPEDAAEEKLVTALAVAMWKEIRADRTEAGVLAAMPCNGDAGRDLGEKRHTLSLGTAIRYASAAGMATQRAHRAFLAHRKAKKDCLALAAPAALECTNELPAASSEPAPQNRTNEFATAPPRPAIDPLAALRTRIRRLLDATGVLEPDAQDLAAAVLAIRLPGAAPYHGLIDLAALDSAVAPLHFDGAALGWLVALASPDVLPEAQGGPPRRQAA